MAEYYLGIDPGRSKTGLALTDIDGKIISLHIAVSENISGELVEFIEKRTPQKIIIGNGTNSNVIAAAVKKVFPGIKLVVIKEAHSTEEARGLYWQENPPSGWRKLMPLGMLVPPIALDAYAAVVLIRRYLQQNN